MQLLSPLSFFACHPPFCSHLYLPFATFYLCIYLLTYLLCVHFALSRFPFLFFSSSLTSNKISSSLDFFPHSLLFCLPLQLCLTLGHCSAFILDKAVQYVCFHTKNVPVLWLLLFFKFFLSQFGCHRQPRDATGHTATCVWPFNLFTRSIAVLTAIDYGCKNVPRMEGPVVYAMQSAGQHSVEGEEETGHCNIRQSVVEGIKVGWNDFETSLLF